MGPVTRFTETVPARPAPRSVVSIQSGLSRAREQGHDGAASLGGWACPRDGGRLLPPGGLHLANVRASCGVVLLNTGGANNTSPQSTAEACTDSRLKSSGSLQSEQLASPIKALASNKRSLHRLERSFFLVRTACVLCRACLLCPVRGICCPSSHPFHSLLLESFRHASGSLSAIMTQLQWRAPPKSGH